MRGGETLSYVDQALALHRSGRPEPVWMNLDYSPIRDEDGDVAGVELLGKPSPRESLAQRIRQVLHEPQQKNRARRAAPAAVVEATPAIEEARTMVQVLLVEDDDDIRENTAEHMRIQGCEVTEAASGEAALQLRAERQPDIVLTDVGLAGLQGDELARRVKDAGLPSSGAGDRRFAGAGRCGRDPDETVQPGAPGTGTCRLHIRPGRLPSWPGGTRRRPGNRYPTSGRTRGTRSVRRWNAC